MEIIVEKGFLPGERGAGNLSKAVCWAHIRRDDSQALWVSVCFHKRIQGWGGGGTLSGHQGQYLSCQWPERNLIQLRYLQMRSLSLKEEEYLLLGPRDFKPHDKMHPGRVGRRQSVPDESSLTSLIVSIKFHAAAGPR